MTESQTLSTRILCNDDSIWNASAILAVFAKPDSTHTAQYLCEYVRI